MVYYMGEKTKGTAEKIVYGEEKKGKS